MGLVDEVSSNNVMFLFASHDDRLVFGGVENGKYA